MLGNYGHLGNQMFQYASLVGISKKNESTPKIPEYTLNAKARDGIELGCFNLTCDTLTNDDIGKIRYQYEEPHFHFDERVFTLPAFTDIRGYFQSEKYFIHAESEIRSQFSFRKEILDRASIRRSKLSDGNLVSIHVRRDDYVHLKDHHHNQTLEYYEKGIEHLRDVMNDNVKFVVFSDDIDWCMENMKDLPVMFENKRHTSVDDMCLMTLCDGHIIANSSFSWWGSYLSNKDPATTVAPKIWFGPKGPKDFYDVYRKGWAVL